jgi:hypothetical protein
MSPASELQTFMTNTVPDWGEHIQIGDVEPHVSASQRRIQMV